MKPVSVTTITLIQHEDDTIDCVVSSHPDGCVLEEFAAGIIQTIRATMDAAQCPAKTPSAAVPTVVNTTDVTEYRVDITWKRALNTGSFSRHQTLADALEEIATTTANDPADSVELFRVRTVTETLASNPSDQRADAQGEYK